jgi:hypothetical protein
MGVDEKVTFTFNLGGKSECGLEDKPDHCTDYNDLNECVMAMFYDGIGKDDPLDLIRAYCIRCAEESIDSSRMSAFLSISHMIDKIKESPSQVIERAKIEGWYPK